MINDGDTVGSDEAERIRVVYGSSSFGAEGRVMQLVYEPASRPKPWYRPW